MSNFCPFDLAKSPQKRFSEYLLATFGHLLSTGFGQKFLSRKSKGARTLQQHTHPYVLMSTHPPRATSFSCVCVTPLGQKDKRVKSPKMRFSANMQVHLFELESNMKRCDRCRCFYPNPPSKRPDQITFTCDGTYGGGECRRHPPLHEEDLRLARFPTVACDWWCGEFASVDDRIHAPAMSPDDSCGESESHVAIGHADAIGEKVS